MSVLLYCKRYNAAKIEASAGTAEVLANADAAENFFNPTFEADIPAFLREGQLSASPMSSVPGARSGKMTVTTHMWTNGTNGTPYWLSTLLPSCGFTNNGSGVYTPITGGGQTITETLHVHGQAYTIAGAQGNLKIMADKVGEPVKLEWTHTGLYINPGTQTALTPTFPVGANTPVRWAGSTLTLGAGTYIVRKFELDMQNKVILREQGNESTGAGYIGTIVTDRDPKITLTVEAPDFATHDFFADQRNSTEAAFSCAFVKTGAYGGTITLAAPKAQIRTAPKLTNIDGLHCYDLELGCNRNSSAGDDEVSITYATA